MASNQSEALVSLGRYLLEQDYRFHPVTQETQAIVIAREQSGMCSLEDVFGWNRYFTTAQLAPDMLRLLDEAGLLEPSPDNSRTYRSRCRASTWQDAVYFHSSFPTDAQDSVFLGPDTFRFLRALSACVEAESTHAMQRIVDLGSGAGPAAIMLAKRFPGAQVIASDINQNALALARINAEINRVENVQFIESDLFAAIEGDFDLVTANPPFIFEDGGKAYSDGGGNLGLEISLRIVAASISRLRINGRLLLYTGVPIQNGCDHFCQEVRQLCQQQQVDLRYEEIDPDIFSTELRRTCHQATDRIAAVWLALRDRRSSGQEKKTGI